MTYETKTGLPLGRFQEMARKQRNVCGICHRPEPLGRLVIDHDHVTGFVRGLLCRKCNVGLGMFEDDPQRMQAAARYVKAHAARSAVIRESCVLPSDSRMADLVKYHQSEGA